MFLARVVVGASIGLGPVIDFSDAMIFTMALPTVVGLYLVLPVVRDELRRYEAELASGDIRVRDGNDQR